MGLLIDMAFEEALYSLPGLLRRASRGDLYPAAVGTKNLSSKI